MSRRVPKVRVTAPLDDVDPPPPRRRRVMLLVVLALAVLLVGVRIWWGWVAERRFDVAVRELQAVGALTPEAPAAGPLPDDEHNAATFIRRATAAAERDGTTPDLDLAFDSDQVPLPPNVVSSLTRLIRANQDALREMREARRIRSVWWNESTAVSDPPENPGTSQMFRQRKLGVLIGYAVLQARATGDDAEAVERLRDMIFLAHAIERERRFLAIAVAVGVRAIACDRLHAICPTLRVGPELGAAPAVAVRGLCDELINEQMFAERVLIHDKRAAAPTLDWIRSLQAGTPANTDAVPGQSSLSSVDPSNWFNVLVVRVAGPFYAMQGARYLSHRADVVRALQRGNLASVRIHFPAEVSGPTRTTLFGAKSPSQAFTATADLTSVTFLWKGPTVTQLAAAQLAIRSYAVDHDSRLPPNLAALVPKYLSAVPTDPFAPPGTPIGYVPTAPRPFVYSVWDSGSDAIASGRWKVPPTLAERDKWRQPNLVWFLGPAVGPSAATQPATGGS